MPMIGMAIAASCGSAALPTIALAVPNASAKNSAANRLRALSAR